MIELSRVRGETVRTERLAQSQDEHAATRQAAELMEPNSKQAEKRLDCKLICMKINSIPNGLDT